mmetsp:Transcript_14942/g.62170  ORF Transcript_14942/g.62170 Transcript_14942/m.62170 type:complete len:455 (+) Transcript_14942:1787-3151(+)
MEVRVHVQVCALEVALHNQLVLLRIAARDDQIVLAADKPVELLEPVHLSRLLDGRHGLDLLQLLFHLALSGGERGALRVERFLLLLCALLSRAEVQACVGVRALVKADLYPHVPLVVLVQSIPQQERDGVALELEAVDESRHRVTRLFLSFDELPEILPVHATRECRVASGDGRVDRLEVVLDQLRFAFLQLDLLLESLGALCLITLHLGQFAERGGLLLRALCFGLLLLDLREVFVHGRVERVEFQCGRVRARAALATLSTAADAAMLELRVQHGHDVVKYDAFLGRLGHLLGSALWHLGPLTCDVPLGGAALRTAVEERVDFLQRRQQPLLPLGVHAVKRLFGVRTGIHTCAHDGVLGKLWAQPTRVMCEQRLFEGVLEVARLERLAQRSGRRLGARPEVLERIRVVWHDCKAARVVPVAAQERQHVHLTIAQHEVALRVQLDEHVVLALAP